EPGTIDGYKRSLASPALIVYGARHQFLSGSRFPLNQHGHIGGTYHATDLKYAMHFRRLAEHPAKNRAIFEPATKMANLHVNIRLFKGHASRLLTRSEIEGSHSTIS